MRIRAIFEILKDRLFSTQYESEKSHVLDILVDNWFNVQYLEAFFEQNKADLDSLAKLYNEEITVEDAIELTIDLADELFQELYKEDGNNLKELFHALDDNEQRIYDFQKAKAKGSYKKSWLRIYAVHFDDAYVVTGGTIKLHFKMQDRIHTNEELKKLTSMKDALKLNEVDELFVYKS